jgi:hypothetical protein
MSGSVLADYLAGTDPKSRRLVERLSKVLSRSAEPLDVAVKWRRLTFAQGGDFHHWICGVHRTKSAVDLVFHSGGLLRGPDSRLIGGASRFLRKLEFGSLDEVDEAMVLRFVNEALAPPVLQGQLEGSNPGWRYGCHGLERAGQAARVDSRGDSASWPWPTAFC